MSKKPLHMQQQWNNEIENPLLLRFWVFSQVFYGNPFTAAGVAFINNQSMAQSAALYQSVCLALVAPSFKGGTSDVTEGSFWGGQRCEIHHRSCGTFSSIPVAAFLMCVCFLILSEKSAISQIFSQSWAAQGSPLGVWLFVCLPRIRDLKFLGPFRLPSMSSISL